MRSFFALIAVALLASCGSTSSPPSQQPTPTPDPPPQVQPAPPTPELPSLPNGAPMSPSSLYIFADTPDVIFLGCLSCPAGDPNSVHSQYGLYGGEYSVSSIFNNYGQYGSPYSIYSACNPYTLSPPVVIDGAGDYYGRLTVNTAHVEKMTNPLLYEWLTTIVCV